MKQIFFILLILSIASVGRTATIITWEPATVSINGSGIMITTTREITTNDNNTPLDPSDDIVTYRMYNVKNHNSATETEIKDTLKVKILKDRTKMIAEDLKKSLIDLSDFETYLAK